MDDQTRWKCVTEANNFINKCFGKKVLVDRAHVSDRGIETIPDSVAETKALQLCKGDISLYVKDQS